MASNRYYPDGVSIKDKFIRQLKAGECDCAYDDINDHFVQGRNVFQRLQHPNNI
jgi:hypothetical protein